MKYTAIFYTDQKFRSREVPLTNQLKSIGFDDIIHYKREWLETTDFYQENKEILDMPRGNGYWLWKPFIFIETMKNIQENDVVYYMDAGDEIHNFDMLGLIKRTINSVDYMIGGSSRRPINKKYIKRDCFILMDCDEEKYHNISQIEAGTLVFKKTKFIEELLNEWLYYSKNKNIITDLPNIYGETYKEFIDHRHDQSILTLLTLKHNMKPNETLYSYIKYNYFKP